MTVVKTTKTTFCNMCGKEFDLFDDAFGFNVSYDVGFGSKYDAERCKIDLCCSCFDKFVDQCKISPIRSALEHKLK